MKLKHKALLYNFLAFTVLFLAVRMLIGYFIPLQRLFLAIIAAIVATVFAPKFAIARINGLEKLVMKWIFKKGFKEF